MFGGEHSGGVFPAHLVYDVWRDAWARLPDMPVPVHGVTGMWIDSAGWIHVRGSGRGTMPCVAALHSQRRRVASLRDSASSHAAVSVS